MQSRNRWKAWPPRRQPNAVYRRGRWEEWGVVNDKVCPICCRVHGERVSWSERQVLEEATLIVRRYAEGDGSSP